MRIRNCGLIAGVGVAGVMALASAAFACTTFKGSLTVATPGGTSVAVGKDDGAHQFCSVSGGAQAAAGDTITVTAAAGDTCPTQTSECQTLQDTLGWCPALLYTPPVAGGNRLPSSQSIADDGGVGPYDVIFGPDRAWDDNGGTSRTFYGEKCRSLNGGIVMGTMTIDAGGNGTGSYALPAAAPTNSPGEEAAICVFNPGSTNIDEQWSIAPIDII